MKRILCLFDYGPNCHTGFATVSRNIVSELKNSFGDSLHLDICAINNFDPPAREYNDTVLVLSGVNIENNDPAIQVKSKFGLNAFLGLLRDYNYDGIFVILDLGAFAPIMPALNLCMKIKMGKGHKRPLSILYFPVDGMMHARVLNESITKQDIANDKTGTKEFVKSAFTSQFDALSFFSVVVTYTEFGRTEVLKHKPDLKDLLGVAYHGINTSDFRPLDEQDRLKFRRKYFGDNSGKYIIGNINRNQPRKDIPTTIFGFIEAKKNWDKSMPAPFLYLHMDPADPNGWKLRNLLSLTDLVENRDYMFPKYADDNSQVDIETLNKIYNSLDVYITTSRGGGWELSVTEAMACKIPVIIPKHTSMAEIGKDGRTYLLEEFLPVSDITDNQWRQMCHFEEVSEKIIESATALYNKESDLFAVRNLQIENAFEWIRQLTWDKICRENWCYYFRTLYNL